MALVGALTPLVKVAKQRDTWLSSALLYTFGGLLTSSAVGALLGLLGQSLGTPRFGKVLVWAGAGLALLLAAREAGWIRFPLPERKLQTEKQWRDRFGARTAALMWGVHLGLTLFTRINFGGLWLLILVAIGAGDPRYGAALMAVHWLGRTLPVWQAPAVMSEEQLEAPVMADELFRTRHLYTRIQALGLVAASAVLVLWGLDLRV